MWSLKLLLELAVWYFYTQYLILKYARKLCKENKGAEKEGETAKEKDSDDEYCSPLTKELAELPDFESKFRAITSAAAATASQAATAAFSTGSGGHWRWRRQREN